MRSFYSLIMLDLAPPNFRAEPHPIFANDDAVEALQSLQIDQQLWRSEPKREHRHEALSAGYDLRVS